MPTRPTTELGAASREDTGHTGGCTDANTEPPCPGPPQRRDAARNRVRLLQAARELFAERGLGVTLDDIARHAGLGVGTAYRNFANRDVLLDDLLVDQMESVAQMAVECLREPDAWQGLCSFLDRALAMQLADRGLKQSLYQRSRGDLRVELARQKIAPSVAELVARAQQAGVLSPDIRSTDIPVVNIMVGAVIDFSRDSDPELYTRYLQLVLRGLRAGTGPELRTPALEMPHLQETMRRWHGG